MIYDVMLYDILMCYTTATDTTSRSSGRKKPVGAVSIFGGVDLFGGTDLGSVLYVMLMCLENPF